MKNRVLILALILPISVSATEILRTKENSPICSNKTLVENLNSAINSGSQSDIISARTIMNISGCRAVAAGQNITVISKQSNTINVKAVDMNGQAVNGYMSMSNLEDPIKIAEQEAAKAAAEEARGLERARTRQENELAEASKLNRYKSNQETNKINCESGIVTGLISGAGGIMFSPLDMLERAYANKRFRDEALASDLSCVVGRGYGGSYCTGLEFSASMKVQPRDFYLGEYQQYGEGLKNYITFVQQGTVNGVPGEFQFFARKVDFKCITNK